MFQKITRKNLEKFLSKHATDAKVLDIGSGGSSYERFFPNRITVDIDPARKPAIVADAHALPFNDNEFEFILCTEMLEHVKDPFKVEKEIRRVMKKGGKLVLSTRFVFPLHDTPNDFWRFTKYGLLNIFKEWEVVEIVGETDSFSTIGALLQRIVFQSELRFNKISKFFILLGASILDKFNWFIVKEFGDIRKQKREKNIMSTGYYLVAQKR